MIYSLFKEKRIAEAKIQMQQAMETSMAGSLHSKGDEVSVETDTASINMVLAAPADLSGKTIPSLGGEVTVPQFDYPGNASDGLLFTVYVAT